MPMSARRAEEAGDRRLVVGAALARDRGCRGRGLIPDHVCAGGEDVHEVLARSQGGDPLDLDGVVVLCRSAHDWTHAHPVEAEALGLRRRRSTGP